MTNRISWESFNVGDTKMYLIYTFGNVSYNDFGVENCTDVNYSLSINVPFIPFISDEATSYTCPFIEQLP